MSHRNFLGPVVSFPANIDANAVSDSREAPFAAQTWPIAALKHGSRQTQQKPRRHMWGWLLQTPTFPKLIFSLYFVAGVGHFWHEIILHPGTTGARLMLPRQCFCFLLSLHCQFEEIDMQVGSVWDGIG